MSLKSVRLKAPQIYLCHLVNDVCLVFFAINDRLTKGLKF
jgi:hypothetical protein